MIEFEDVDRYYGVTRAVSGLSFRIEHGECVGLLGLNGAGKSTTLRMLSGSSLPTRGRVKVSGRTLGVDSRELRASIGYLPDTPPLYGDMAVLDFLRFAARLRGLSRTEAGERSQRVLGTCGLERVAHEPIASLSHGYRQRVGIAQAIVHGPRLVVLDEPSQGLDPAQNLEMRTLVRSLRGQHTVVLSTHLLADIRECCDRILLMHEGRLHAEGTERELLERFATRHGGVSALVRGERDAVQAALSRVPEHELVGLESEREGLRLELRAGRDLRGELSRALIESGLELLELHATESGLEQLFVSLGKERG